MEIHQFRFFQSMDNCFGNLEIQDLTGILTQVTHQKFSSFQNFFNDFKVYQHFCLKNP